MKDTFLTRIVAVLAVAGASIPFAKAEPTAYLAVDLVSDQAGVAGVRDPQLVGGWGIALSPAGAFFVSSEGADLSPVYSGDVTTPLVKTSLEVAVPGGQPTGQVFNGTSDFAVSNGTIARPALFIFASRTGAVTGWNPSVSAATAEPAFQASDNAIYTGIALANNGAGNFLYLADFHNGKIDVLDAHFHPVRLAGAFTDSFLPSDYAPHNVAVIGGKLYVAYAKRDANAQQAITGGHRGFVDVFDLNGNFEQRLVSRGKLNAPWGMVLAPAAFGDFGGALLVGNSGNGRINAYDPATGAHLGTLGESPHRPIEIDGLRGLAFGNGVNAGSATTLYYAAGPDHETHGLFGKITANPAGTSPVQTSLTGGSLVITGSRNDDRIDVELDRKSAQIVVLADHREIGSFDLASVGLIQIQGLAGDDRIRIAQSIAIPAIADGGAGNDHIIGGGGNNILLGGPGDDELQGSGDRDILIGGEGRDSLQGGDGDDLLVGGSTAYDTNLPVLLQILVEWTSNDLYATRVQKLRNGVGVPKLDSTVVLDDAAKDILRGGRGLDWFLAGPDDDSDQRPPEQVN